MKLFFLIILFLKTSSYSLERVCRSPEGKTVDWYVIFLYPQNSSPEKKLMYGYIDDTSSSLKDYEYNEKTFPPTKITQYTLNEDDVNFNYFFWNDDTTCKNESKTSAPDSRAHAKGSLVYDENKGAFLLHSLPRFPTRTKDGEVLTELPSNGGQYAQSFLCLSVNKNYAERIVEILNIINVSNNKSVKKDRVNTSPNEWVTKLIKNVFNTR
jgi:deoxyribonuclease-2